MERTPVNSDNIKAVGYDVKEYILEVEFHKGNSLYRYEKVSPEAYKGLIEAESPGKFFQIMIKGKYLYSIAAKEQTS